MKRKKLRQLVEYLKENSKSKSVGCFQKFENLMAWSKKN